MFSLKKVWSAEEEDIFIEHSANFIGDEQKNGTKFVNEE